MKSLKMMCICLLLVFAVAIQGLHAATPTGQTEKKIVLKTEKEKASYAIGLNIGQSIRFLSSEVDLNIIFQGIKDAVAGKDKPQLTQDEVNKILQDFQIKTNKLIAERNKTEGEAFLLANGKKAGIKTTATGLQYQVIKEGTGVKPKATDTVKVHYRGTFIDGSEFDSSYKRNEPTSFPLNQVIPAWTEGVQLMKVGSKYRFFVPAKLGYGERGAGAAIPPNAALIFEVELLGIEAPVAQPPATPKK